jgi:hypothetical protein
MMHEPVRPRAGKQVRPPAESAAPPDSKPLPQAVAERMEAAYSADLSAVRIHDGVAADRLASSLDAHAVTKGTDVFFRTGAFRPGTRVGDRLLAHELAHVVQRPDGVERAPADGKITGPHEADAVAAADRLVSTTAPTNFGLVPLPASPARARLLASYSDQVISTTLYGGPDVPIVHRAADIIDVNYGTLLPEWRPLFVEAASPFERVGALRTEQVGRMGENGEIVWSDRPVWTPLRDPLRGGLVIGYYRKSGGYVEVRNTDGEIVGTYEPGLEHGIPILDPLLDLVEEGLRQAGYVLVGGLDTWLEDNWRALGLHGQERPLARLLGLPEDSVAYSLGRGAGHLISLLQSAAEMVSGAALVVTGIGEFLLGMATTPEGVGFVIAPVGIVTIAAGSVIVIHGGALGGATVMAMSSTGSGGSAPKDPRAEKIGNGHAYDKHVVKQKEFPEIKDKSGFIDLIDRVMKSPQTRSLTGGRIAWWEDATKTLVIHDPASPDLGTCFRPTAGIAYFLGLL